MLIVLGYPRGTALWVAGVLVSACVWWVVSRRAPVDRWTLLRVYLGGLVGAFAGAKLAYLIGEGWAHLHDARALLTGKSILGAIPGGYAGVVCTKHVLGVRRHTGDWFALAVPCAVAVGRVACLLQGCCAGVVCSEHWWAWHDATGLPRWPAQATELAFNAGFAGWALLAGRTGWSRDNRFHVYMIAYGAFRSVHEFARDTERLGSFTGYQAVALGVCTAGIVLYRRRARERRAGLSEAR